MKTHFLKILRMNQKLLTMICLKNILNLKYLLSWQKHYLKQKIKNNNELVSAINSGLIDFKKEIEKMSKEEKKNEKPNKILKIVKKILEFNRKKQSAGGLKILTPNQMLSRLPITLAQLKAGNNSEKLKNEIRQLLYSLYHSKNMIKRHKNTNNKSNA